MVSAGRYSTPAAFISCHVALQALNAEVTTHRQSLQAQTTKISRLEQQLAEAQQLSTQLDATLSSTRAELRGSRDKASSLEEANRKLSEEVEAGLQLSVDVVNLKSELDSAQRRQEEQQLAMRSKLNKFGLQASCMPMSSHTWFSTLTCHLSFFAIAAFQVLSSIKA